MQSKFQADALYDYFIEALEDGQRIDVIRREAEAAYRHVEGMKQRPIFSGKYPEDHNG